LAKIIYKKGNKREGLFEKLEVGYYTNFLPFAQRCLNYKQESQKLL